MVASPKRTDPELLDACYSRRTKTLPNMFYLDIERLMPLCLKATIVKAVLANGRVAAETLGVPFTNLFSVQ
jgi:hypothetical protein